MNFQENYLHCVSVRKDISVEQDPTLLIPNLYSYDALPVSESERCAFLHLLAAGNLSCEDLFSFSFQPMDCCMLLYTQGGSGKLSVNGTSVSLTENHLLFFDCRQLFSLQVAVLPWSFKIFFLSGDRLGFFRDLLHAKQAPLFLLPKFSPLPQTFSQLLGISESVTLPQFLLMQQLLDQLCTTLCLSAQETDADTSASLSDIPAYLIEMKDLFDHHYAKEFSLSTCQEHYSVSKYRLCREFAEYFGEPPLRYLNHRRLEAAKEMLLNTELNIHEISSLVGFENVNHFINLFKKYVGTTPNSFRQKAPEVLPVLHSPSQ